MPQAHRVDLDRPGLRLRPDLLAHGFSDAELTRLRRTGQLATVRRGAYVPATDERLREPAARHELAVRAAVEQLPPGAVVSHISAAVLHGLDVWGLALDRVHLTRGRCSGGRCGRRLHLHTAPLTDDEVVEIRGILATDVARTVVDLARSVPFEQAVAVADAALRREALARERLLDAVARSVRRPGNRRARRVARFADGGGESVGESRSRVAMYRAGLPAPVLQAQIGSIGRVDFWWPAMHTVGEFDGRVKYGRLLRPGQEPGDAVFAEKLREDALRDEGLRVVRWIWREIHPFDAVAGRLWRAFRVA
jgi:hypothetical protein